MFSPQCILRLLEMIFSLLAVISTAFRGASASPWGVWCAYVWVICFLVSLFFLVMELMNWQHFVSAFVDWADLTCGLTMLCALMVTSATVIFAAIFICFTCVDNIFCFIFSLLATLVFLVDAVLQKSKGSGAYLSKTKGILRMVQAFVACIIITAAADYFLGVELYVRPVGMNIAITVYVIFLLLTIFLILFNMVRLLQGMAPCGLNTLDLVFDVAAMVAYLCALVLWSIYGYKRYRRDWRYWRYPYFSRYCFNCSVMDLNTVTAGTIINIILFVVDLVVCLRG